MNKLKSILFNTLNKIKKIITTNSHPISQHHLIKRSKKFIIKDISPEFVEIIKKIIKS